MPKSKTNHRRHHRRSRSRKTRKTRNRMGGGCTPDWYNDCKSGPVLGQH